MRLRAWLTANGVTVREFATRLGVAERQVFTWMAGRAVPRTDRVADIARLTGNQVTADDHHAAARQRIGALTRETGGTARGTGGPRGSSH